MHSLDPRVVTKFLFVTLPRMRAMVNKNCACATDHVYTTVNDRSIIHNYTYTCNYLDLIPYKGRSLLALVNFHSHTHAIVIIRWNCLYFIHLVTSASAPEGTRISHLVK